MRKPNSSMSVNIIGAIIAVLLAFGLISSLVGYITFTESIKKEYSETTYYMARTAASMIEGDHLQAYLDGQETDEYEQTRADLDSYCEKIHVSLIYIILVDRSDYGRFVSVFNAVDNTVDDSEYTPWELGHQRDTTNDEYRETYRAIYDGEIDYGTVYRFKTTDGQHPHITTLVPVPDSAGEVAGILCMQRPVSELKEARRPYLIIIALSTILLALLSSLFAYYFIRKQFVHPVKRVSREATRFARENTKGEELGQISRYSEISDLAGSIDTMESDMVKYIDNLTEATAEKERIGAELSLASTIQENSIPHDYPAFPERPEFDVCGSMIPAKEVGGDFYNYFLVDDDHLAIAIGDVSGKGVPAALFMMVTNIVLGNRTRLGGDPAEVMTYVNDRICEHNEVNMFITLWMGILELSSGRLIITNAGHDDAALCRRDGRFRLVEARRNIVVGAMEDTEYQQFEIRLEKGDKLFLYTDGVTEATDTDGNMYGLDRMLAALDGCREKRPPEVLNGIHESIGEFIGTAPQFDDLTMLCLEYLGAPEETGPEESRT